MLRNTMKKIIPIICSIIIIFNGLGIVDASPIETLITEDFDKLVDINVTVEIYAIRSLVEIDDLPEPNLGIALGKYFTSSGYSNTTILPMATSPTLYAFPIFIIHFTSFFDFGF